MVTEVLLVGVRSRGSGVVLTVRWATRRVLGLRIEGPDQEGLIAIIFFCGR